MQPEIRASLPNIKAPNSDRQNSTFRDEAKTRSGSPIFAALNLANQAAPALEAT
jgi:hypothetical protein